MGRPPREELAYIRELINQNKLSTAQRRLDRIRPDWLEKYERGFYYFLLGRFDHLKGNYRVVNANKAIRLLRPFADQDDLFHWSMMLKAVIFRRSHRLKRAIPIFEDLEREAPKAGHFVVEAAAVGQLAQHTAATGDIDRAEILFARAIDRYHFEQQRVPRRATIHNRAMWLARYGRFSEADAAYMADPISVEEWGKSLAQSYTVNRAFNLALRRRTKTALNMLRQWYRENRADAAQSQIYHVNKGVAYLFAANYGKALRNLNIALAIGLKSRHATVATVYKWLGLCHLLIGDRKRCRKYARMTLRQALRSQEVFEIGGAYFLLGWSYALESRLIDRLRARAYIIDALRAFGDIGAKWDLAMVQYRAAHLGLFPPHQCSQMIRLSTRYFRSERIKPPRIKGDFSHRLGDAIRFLGDDDRNELLRLLDLD